MKEIEMIIKYSWELINKPVIMLLLVSIGYFVKFLLHKSNKEEEQNKADELELGELLDEKVNKEICESNSEHNHQVHKRLGSHIDKNEKRINKVEECQGKIEKGLGFLVIKNGGEPKDYGLI